LSKRRYPRTSRKNTDVNAGLTRVERREYNMRAVIERVEGTQQQSVSGVELEEAIAYHTDPRKRYHISTDRRSPINIHKFIADNAGNPAIEVGAI
jgi:hypothetical protein